LINQQLLTVEAEDSTLKATKILRHRKSPRCLIENPTLHDCKQQTSKASFKQAPSTLQAKFKQGSSQVSKQGFRDSKELSGGATVNTVVSVLLRAIVVVASLVKAKDLKDSCHSSRLFPPFGIRISARASLKKQQRLTTTTTRTYHNSSMASTIPCRLLLLLETLLLERAAKSSETRRIIIRKGFSTYNFERIRFAKR
jgi:hypothetical protein